MTAPPALTQITNDLDEITSTEVIDRIALLEQYQAAADAEGAELPAEEAEELCRLVDLELQCVDRARGAWRNGTVLMRFEHDPHLVHRGLDSVDFAGVTYWLLVG